MSSEFLVEEKVIAVRKELLQGVGVLAGLDRGCTLTKVLFSTEKDADHYNLHFALFRNCHFEAGLDYLRLRGMVVQTPGAKLHVTGAGCDMYRDVVRDKLGLDIEFIDEMLTQSRGLHWLLTNIADEQLCYPDPVFADGELTDVSQNAMLKVFLEAWRRDVGEITEGKFPCLMLFVGSGAGIFKVEADGTADIIGGPWLAGRSFLGLSQLLLGTADYDEIMRLAGSGSRRTLDTLVQDVLANDENSPYGTFPPDFPLFSFGKAADMQCRLSDVPREDVAASLLESLLISMFSMLALAAKTLRIGKLYFCGNFFRSHVSRKMVVRHVAMFGGLSDRKVLQVKFLKTGHTGAVGAMVSKPEDVQKYMAYMQQQPQQEQQIQEKQQQQQQ